MPFANSSHAKNWIFTPQQLETIRLKCNDAVRAKMKPDVEILTLEEQSMLRLQFESRIPGLCKTINLPDKCHAAAIMFFKRFYLAYTVMDYDPKIILLTCIYLASKTEESRIGIDELCKAFKATQSVEKLLQNETILLQGIKFELQVYHPFRPLHGFLMSASETLGIDVTEIRNLSLMELNNILKTDLPLLYPPSLLALSSLSKVAQKLNHSLFSSFLSSTLSLSSPDAQKMVDEIIMEMDKSGKREPLSTEIIKKLDSKMKICANAIVREINGEEREKREREEREKEEMKVKKMMEREKADMELLTGNK